MSGYISAYYQDKSIHITEVGSATLLCGRPRDPYMLTARISTVIPTCGGCNAAYKRALKAKAFREPVTLPDTERGLYQKYIVTRTDGSSARGRKHADCTYFVLDLNHDSHARAALVTYIESCQDTRPLLAADLRRLLERYDD